MEERMQQLESRMDALEQVNAHQTTILEEIKTSTKGLVDAWQAASGAWRVLEGISKVVKLIVPIFLGLTAIGVAAKVYVAGQWKALIEVLVK